VLDYLSVSHRAVFHPGSPLNWFRPAIRGGSLLRSFWFSPPNPLPRFLRDGRSRRWCPTRPGVPCGPHPSTDGVPPFYIPLPPFFFFVCITRHVPPIDHRHHTNTFFSPHPFMFGFDALSLNLPLLFSQGDHGLPQESPELTFPLRTRARRPPASSTSETGLDPTPQKLTRAPNFSGSLSTLTSQ